MTKFFAYLEQESGCDYTMACGRKLVEVEGAKSVTDAGERVLREYDYDIVSGENKITAIAIIEAVAVAELDLELFERERLKQMAADTLASKEASERAEFERLRKKFE